MSISFEPHEGPLWQSGVVFAALNLGLMLADSSAEDLEVQSALSSLYGYAAYPFLVRGMARAMGLRTIPEPGAVRSMGDSCPAGSVHWLSSITWDSTTHKAVILLPQAKHLAMTAPGSPWVAVLFRTDSCGGQQSRTLSWYRCLASLPLLPLRSHRFPLLHCWAAAYVSLG